MLSAFYPRLECCADNRVLKLSFPRDSLEQCPVEETASVCKDDDKQQLLTLEEMSLLEVNPIPPQPGQMG